MIIRIRTMFTAIVLLLSAAFSSAVPAAHALDAMQFYFGNLHSHTRYSDGSGTPRDAYTWARDVAGLDFYAVTDHGETVDPYEWWLTGRYADAYNRDGSFIALRGFEWSHPFWGHVTVWNTSSYTNAVIDYNMDKFYAWLDDHNGLAQFNHPGREIGLFEWFALSSRAVDNMVGIETGNGGSGNDDTIEAYYRWFLYALDQGWTVAPTFGQDNHTLSFSNGGRTVVLASALTRAAIIDGLQAKRVYSTDDPNMKVAFVFDDQWMGSRVTVAPNSSATFDVVIEDDEPIIQAELLTHDGRVMASQSFPSGTTTASWSPSVTLTDERYVLLRVRAEDRNGDMPGHLENVAFTAPFWIDYQ
jgi:hypothetical protein